MANYAGRKGMVYIGTTGGGAASLVLGQSKFSIDQTTDKIDVTSFGAANKIYVQGLPDVKGSFSGFWDDTESKPFTAPLSAGAVNMYLYPSTDAPTKYKYGTAWLDISLSVDVEGAVTVSSNFVAAGSWGSTL